MKRYLNKEDFLTFCNQLEENKSTKLFTESKEDGSVDEYVFLKIKFKDSYIILYEHPAGCAGIIQDTPVAPWEDYAETTFEDLEQLGEYTVFIEKTVTREDVDKMIDALAETFPPDTNSPKWQEAIMKAQDNIVKQYMEGEE